MISWESRKSIHDLLGEDKFLRIPATVTEIYMPVVTKPAAQDFHHGEIPK